MGHTHSIIEAEMGCSHLLSTMETASANLVYICIKKGDTSGWNARILSV